MPITQSYDELYPSKWIKASDLPEDGKPMAFTVKDLSFEGVGQDKEMRLCIAFTETDKKLIANKTNAATLVSLFGKDLNKAIGQRIGLFATAVSYAGQMTMGVRVYPQRIAAKPAAAPQPPQQARQVPPPPPPPDDDSFLIEQGSEF